MWRSVILSVCLACLSGQLVRADESPKSLDSRLKVELFAEHPQIVTPTGLDVDHRGRVFAIESNTHFPPEGYKGHPTDRVLVMSDSDGDGKGDKIVVFTDGLKFSMSVAVRPIWFPVAATKDQPQPKQSVYIATRREIFLFHDDDGDDKADRKESIVHLDTKGDYPHNGLAGFAIDALGWMYFGFGENLGADYKIIGSDGTTLSGGGEGGNIYRCRLDGSKLSQIATGFWNPHASCFDAFGRLFTVDNDADSRPPCRLLHVIPGGDYGYRFRNGRKGLHPFTAWNGEIPGTLPMVAGTGEAPSGILAYESDGLPEEYLGNLLVTSWGDHRIDRFRLQPKGTSFTSLAEPLITGGENFRPVGLATAPDGSLFCTDWVLRDYKLHGHGRIWRIAPKELRVPTKEATGSMPHGLLGSKSLSVRRRVAQQMAQSSDGRGVLVAKLLDQRLDDRIRVEAAYALATVPRAVDDILKRFEDADPERSRTRAGSVIPFEKIGVAEVAYLRTFVIDSPQVADESAVTGIKSLLGLGYLMRQRTDQPVPSEAFLPPEKLGVVASFVSPSVLDQSSRDYDFLAALLNATLDKADPFEFSALVNVLGQGGVVERLQIAFGDKKFSSAKARAALLLAARKQAPREDRLLRVALSDHDPDVRRLAVQWVAEEKLTDLKPRVAAMFDSKGMTTELFLATIAALEMLDGKKPEDFDKTPAEQYVVPLLKDEKRSPAVRAQALRLVSPTDKSLDAPFFASLLKSEHEPLRIEAVRTLQAAKPDVSGELLRELVANDKLDVPLRAEALVGLAAVAKVEPVGGPSRKLLHTFLNNHSELPLRFEALRAARPLIGDDAEIRNGVTEIAKTAIRLPDGTIATNLADQAALAFAEAKLDLPEAIMPHRSDKPKTPQEWMGQLARGGDPAAGRRIFFHSNGAGCFKCHIIDGRGGRVGPDLSRVVGTMNRERLIQSILEPSREIAPQFVSWTFELKDGKVVTGMVVHENEGKTVVGNAEGQLIEIKTIDIETRTPQKISVMPEKLAERMTLQEFRDLLAFLDSQH